MKLVGVLFFWLVVDRRDRESDRIRYKDGVLRRMIPDVGFQEGRMDVKIRLEGAAGER